MQLATLGMGERDRNVLELFVDKLPQHQCTLVEEAVADASIVDLDAFGSTQLLAKHREHYPDRPVIVLSVTQQQGGDGELFVPKPIRPQQLIQALNDLRERVLRDSPTSIPIVASEPGKTDVLAPAVIPVAGYSKQFDVAAANSASEKLSANSVDVHESFNFLWNMGPDLGEEIYYRPEWYLQGHIQKAVTLAYAKNVMVRLTGTNWRPITIIPHTGLISVQQHDGHLRSASLLPQRRTSPERRRDVVVTLLRNPGRTDNDGTQVYQPIEYFLWKLALWTSRGRVPAGTVLEQPVRMLRWPNHTRLLLTPHVLRISALLMQQPYSLPQVAKALEIEYGYVFAYYSAASAIGLVERPAVGRPAASDQRAESVSGEKSFLRLGMLRRLHRFIMDEQR